MESLRFENDILESRIAGLESQLEQAKEKINKLEDQLEESEEELIELKSDVYGINFKLELCEMNFEGYKNGDLIQITRYVEGEGRVTIYGAANIIEFLGRHYRP